jgi:hypothetical protein
MGRGASLIGRARKLDAAGLAAADNRELSFDSDRTELGERGRGLLRRARDPAGRDRDPKRFQNLFRLVLEQLHVAWSMLRSERRTCCDPQAVSEQPSH